MLTLGQSLRRIDKALKLRGKMPKQGKDLFQENEAYPRASSLLEKQQITEKFGGFCMKFCKQQNSRLSEDLAFFVFGL